MGENAGLACRSLESLSLGGVAGMKPQTQLPKKYKAAGVGEVSTYAGAGIVPVTRLPNGETHILLWQPQSGKKQGVRWYDFGGRKERQAEFTSACACRKFAKQTYGVFGCELDLQDNNEEYLEELYQGLANLPLMLRASQEWAGLQLLDDDSRLFYNDIHEYHTFMLIVPYVPEKVLNKISTLVDGGKRIFRWLNTEHLKEEVLAPRLHIASFARMLEGLSDDEWVKPAKTYGDGILKPATSSFAAFTKL